jgi:hypothetical protein
VTGGAFLRSREGALAQRLSEPLLRAWQARHKYLQRIYEPTSATKKVEAMLKAQGSGNWSPFISTTRSRAGALEAYKGLRARGVDAEIIVIRGPRNKMFDFESEFEAVGGRTDPKRLKDADMQEMGIPDLFIPPQPKPGQGLRGFIEKIVPPKARSKSGFYIVLREEP